MDDVSYQKVQQYQQALKALQRSVERSIQEGMGEGTGKMAVKSYQGIQRKIAEMLPEDFYITETLSLEVDGDLKERHMLSQVQLASSQMSIYLDGILRDYRRASGGGVADTSDLRSLGNDLQGQIIELTRRTIRRALTNVDVDVTHGPDSMQGAVMEGAQLEGANFSGRNLKDAILKGANLKSANFSGANLANASLEGADCEGANFSGANLKDTDLRSVNFVGSNLTGANLKNATLEKANLTGAQIGGANFKDADLRGATLPRGEEFRNEGDLMSYGAAARPSGQRHVRVEITRDDDEDEKRKNDDDTPENDEDLV